MLCPRCSWPPDPLWTGPARRRRCHIARTAWPAVAPRRVAARVVQPKRASYWARHLPVAWALRRRCRGAPFRQDPVAFVLGWLVFSSAAALFRRLRDRRPLSFRPSPLRNWEAAPGFRSWPPRRPRRSPRSPFPVDFEIDLQVGWGGVQPLTAFRRRRNGDLDAAAPIIRQNGVPNHAQRPPGEHQGQDGSGIKPERVAAELPPCLELRIDFAVAADLALIVADTLFGIAQNAVGD